MWVPYLLSCDLYLKRSTLLKWYLASMFCAANQYVKCRLGKQLIETVWTVVAILHTIKFRGWREFQQKICFPLGLGLDPFKLLRYCTLYISVEPHGTIDCSYGTKGDIKKKSIKIRVGSYTLGILFKNRISTCHSWR